MATDNSSQPDPVTRTVGARLRFLALLFFGANGFVVSCAPPPPGPFDSSIAEYEGMSAFAEDAQAGPQVQGKVVVVDTGEALSHHYRTAFTTDDDIEVAPHKVSAVQFKIDAALRADNPQQVSTVILLNWRRELLSTNIAGIEFCRVHCEGVVIDKARRRIVARREFSGSGPEGTHRWGSSPEGQIVAWINGLPRRSAPPSTVAGATTSTFAPAEPSAPASAGGPPVTSVGKGGVPSRQAYPPDVKQRFMDGCLLNSPRTFCECGIARFQEVLTVDEFEREEARLSAGTAPSAKFMAVVNECRAKASR